MTRYIRFGIGLDTCLLQAADSFLNQVQAQAGQLGPRAEVLEVDPRAREQFVEAVDIFLDLPAKYLVVPRKRLGHLAEVGDLIASFAAPLTEATEQSPMKPADGIRYYRGFLKQVQTDPLFRRVVVSWGWFQFLDPDVLLGYADRMEVDKDVKFVKDEMREEFASALTRLGDKKRLDVMEKITAITIEFGHDVQQIARLAQILPETGLSSRNVDAARFAEHLAIEIQEYETLAGQFGLSSVYGPSIFLLAYVGSVCRRGWQYNEVYSRQRELSDLVYVAHHMRGEFLYGTRHEGSPEEKISARIYWWSWGSILARAIEQFPTRWPVDRVLMTLYNLRKVLHDEQISISIDNISPTDSVEATRKKSTVLQEIAKSMGIVLARDESHDRLRTWAPTLVRAIPAISIATVAEILSNCFGSPLPAGIPAGLGVLTDILLYALYGDTLGRKANRAIDFLEEKWLVVSGSGLRKKISGGAVTKDSPIGPVALRGQWSIRRDDEALEGR